MGDEWAEPSYREGGTKIEDWNDLLKAVSHEGCWIFRGQGTQRTRSRTAWSGTAMSSA